MRKNDIVLKFEEMFPKWAKKVDDYKKLGNNAITIYFKDGTSRVFLYISKNNWQFGTKLWRKRPEFLERKHVEEKVINKED